MRHVRHGHAVLGEPGNERRRRAVRGAGCARAAAIRECQSRRRLHQEYKLARAPPRCGQYGRHMRHHLYI